MQRMIVASVRRLGLAIAMTPGRFGAVQRLIGHGLKMLQQAADFSVFVLWQIGQAGLLGCWAAGLLGCWAAGLLGCWAAGRAAAQWLVPADSAGSVHSD